MKTSCYLQLTCLSEILVAKKGADMLEYLSDLICNGQYHRG